MEVVRVHRARERIEVIIAEDSFPFKQLNVSLRVHIRDNVVKILEVLAIVLGKRDRKLLQ